MAAPPAYNYGHPPPFSTGGTQNMPFANPQSKIELKIACRFVKYIIYK